MRRSVPFAVAGLLAVGTLLAACGDDSSGSSATTGGGSSAAGITIKATEYKFDLSGTPTAGYEKITFANEGKEPHVVVAVKLKPGKTVADAIPIFEQQGEPDPAVVASLFEGDPNTAFYGTPGLLGPGDTSTTFANFTPGNYALFCYMPAPSGQPHFSLGMAMDRTVADSGGTSTPPKTDGTITISDSTITAPQGMKSGTYEVKNTGSTPSDFAIAGPTDKQISDFDDAINAYFSTIGSGETPPFKLPAPLVGGFSDSIPPGGSGYVVLDLEKGHYLLAGNSDDTTNKTLVSGTFDVS